MYHEGQQEVLNVLQIMSPQSNLQLNTTPFNNSNNSLFCFVIETNSVCVCLHMHVGRKGACIAILSKS